MLINDKEINYNAGYLGPNPLASFIEACLDLYSEIHVVEGTGLEGGGSARHTHESELQAYQEHQAEPGRYL